MKIIYGGVYMEWERLLSRERFVDRVDDGQGRMVSVPLGEGVFRCAFVRGAGS